MGDHPVPATDAVPNGTDLPGHLRPHLPDHPGAPAEPNRRPFLRDA